MPIRRFDSNQMGEWFWRLNFGTAIHNVMSEVLICSGKIAMTKPVDTLIPMVDITLKTKQPRRRLSRWLIALMLQGVALGALHAERDTIDLNDDWKFAMGHAQDKDADFGFNKGYFSYMAKTGYGDGPANGGFDDRGWRPVDLPHDWGVEMPYDPAGSHSHGYKAFGPGFPENSVGWYRKSVFIPEEDLGRRISIEFEGVYRDAMVFVNGFFAGQEPSGYVSPSYDITEYLNFGGGNSIVVRVDAFEEEGWYYEGAGIYRHVTLKKTDALHFKRFGTWVRTDVDAGGARVSIDSKVVNEGREMRGYKLAYTVVDAEGKTVAELSSDGESLNPGGEDAFSHEIFLSEATLWDLDNPYLYTLKTTIYDEAGEVVDSEDTRFGVREIRFDPDHGFFLNGKHVKLKGTNNHQDHAGVGTAIPDALQEWRLKQLKAMGGNAYRASHHPASPALLDLCDELGILVIDENRLQGINDYHIDQLTHMIERDRNHPSIILWSLGNEEWGIESNIKGARITQYMQDYARRLDPTRLNTVAISGGWGGTDQTVEVAGVNYIGQAHPDQTHEEHPWQIIVGTEETTTQQTRGIYFEDKEKRHLSPQVDGSSKGNCEVGWKYYAEREYAAGVFWWTGFDYRGEPTPYDWPAVLSQFGIMDTCGFPKDCFYYLRAWWQDEPVLHLFPHWNWEGREGEVIPVSVNSNAKSVELFLNGKSLGSQEMEENGHLEWEVAYEPGELKAVAQWEDGSTQETSHKTVGEAASLKLTADRVELLAGRKDVAVVTVSADDAKGLAHPLADNLVHFSVEGPGKIIGVGNGNPSSLEADVYVPSYDTFFLTDWEAPQAYLPQPEQFDVEIEFDMPEVSEDGVIRLLINPIGDEQTVVLNGKKLYKKAGPEDARKVVELKRKDLKASGNVLTMTATPFQDYNDRSRVNGYQPVTLSVMTPAAQWNRKLFNGLAQVLVQVDEQTGEVVLTAEAEGLKAAELKLSVKAAE